MTPIVLALLWTTLVGPQRGARAASAPPDPLPPGRYALDMHVGTVTRAPVIGDVRSVTSSRALVDLEALDEPGRPLRATQRSCEVRVDGDAPLGVFTEFPEAFVRALHVQQYRLTLTTRPVAPAAAPPLVVGDSLRAPASVPVTAPLTDLRADLGVEALGFDPARRGLVLPRTGADPAVVDGDGDGRPGVTLLLHLPIGVFALGVASIGHVVLVGHVVDGRGEGRVQVLRQEQRILSSELPLPDELGVATPDPMHSTFRLAPVPPTASCASLRRDLPPLAVPTR